MATGARVSPDRMVEASGGKGRRICRRTQETFCDLVPMPSTLWRAVAAILEGHICRRRCRSRAHWRVGPCIAQVQVVRSACPTQTNGANCSSQRLHGDINNQEVIQAMRCYVCKAGLLL